MTNDGLHTAGGVNYFRIRVSAGIVLACGAVDTNEVHLLLMRSNTVVAAELIRSEADRVPPRGERYKNG